MALNWEKFEKLRRENPIPKFALDKAGKSLKRSPNDPYLLTWKASTLLQIDGRASEALPILLSIGQQTPITDTQLLSLIYSSVLSATRQEIPNSLPLVSAGAATLKAWQNGAKALPHRRAKLQMWSKLFVVAMREACWEDAKHALVQANKEGIDPKFKKQVYYSRILTSQLGGEHRIAAAKAKAEADPGGQIQLDVTLRQMKDAYDSSPKAMDEAIQVSSMSDLRFMATIYERQNRCAELFQLWDHPPPVVEKVISGAPWDFDLLKIEVAQKQEDWKTVWIICFDIIDTITKAGDATQHDPSSARRAMVDICTMGWTVWKSLLEAASHLYSEAEAKDKIWNLFSEVWRILPPRDAKTARAFGLTQLSVEAYCDAPKLDSVTRFYMDCYRTPSCFQDLRRFVALLPIEDQKRFHGIIREHVQRLGTDVAEDSDLEEDALKKRRVWHQAETLVLKFEFLLIVSLVENPDATIVEDFVGNALRLWHLQLNLEDPEAVCASDSLLVAIEALIELFEISAKSHYFYQAAALARYSLSLDKNRQSRKMALLSTRLHLRLGLGTFAFEHYSRVQVKEMLHDNLSWVALARISQSHPYGASGSRMFSPDNELKKVVDTLQRMEDKVDDLLYTDMQRFVYDKAFDLLDLKRKFHTSLTKHFCLIERRRIARLTGMHVSPTLDAPLRDPEDISVNCDWDAMQGTNHTKAGGIGNIHFVWPVTKDAIYYFRTVIDVVNGLVFKEIRPGHAHTRMAPFTQRFVESHNTWAKPDQDFKDFFTFTEAFLINKYWDPIASILRHVYPSETLTVYQDVASENALNLLCHHLKEDLDRFKADTTSAAEGKFDRTPHPTEDGLHYMYGLLEILRVLNALVNILRPLAKSTPKQRNEFSTPRCSELADLVTLNYNAMRLYAETVIKRLKSSGMPHIRAQIFEGRTGAAIDLIISDVTLDRYSREYAESAIEGLKGLLRVQLV